MKKIIILLSLMMVACGATVAWGISFNQEYYSQQKFSPKTASWNDPVGQFIAETVIIIETRGMDDPNKTKIRGPGKLIFGSDEPEDDDFYFQWQDANDMGVYADDSAGNATFHFGTEDANTIDVDLNGDLNIYGGITSTDYVQFDILYSDGVAEGKLQWNAVDGTLEVGTGSRDARRRGQSSAGPGDDHSCNEQ
jgi:hypothetical protein